MVSLASAPSMTSLWKSSLKTSRTILTRRSGSLCSRAGAGTVSSAWLISSHCAVSRLTSRVSCSSVAPSAAVRTITPAFSGSTSLRIFLSRARSVSGSLRRDAVHRTVRHVDEVATGQRHLAGQPCPLVPDGILGDLDEDLVPRLQREFDPARLAAAAGVLRCGIPVDLTGVEHGIAAAPDVDESRLHARQHVLHPAEVDVADERRILHLRNVVLDEHLVLENRDLNSVELGADDHHPVDALAPGEEFRLGDDRAATSGVAAVPAALLLGLEPSGAANLLRLIARAPAGGAACAP